MDFVQFYLYGLITILFCVLALWLLSLRLRDASIVDIFWGTGFVIIAWLYFVLVNANDTRQWIITTFVTLWGIRLSLHIGNRNIGKGEDYRYQVWRSEAGPSWWWRSFLKVFLLQGVILWFVAMPIASTQLYSSGQSLNWIDFVAIVLWIIGFGFEAIGDWQLMQFKANPENKGKVMDLGLWRLTRHPNYFGDAVIWWSYFAFALAIGGWWTIVSPLLMTFLLMRVSGVAMLEQSLTKTKPQYAEYIRRTSAFFPWLPKEDD